ncbi:MAG: 2-dehydro-3-deoxygalactonokinase [Acidobacteria bacterium]|jgi:2-dehydro-3-deoxygalactonokinase|nr:2-dehydro-3-deoxygalactonokinase [Acidobacteriota bacterium]
MPPPQEETAGVLDNTCILYVDGGTTRTRGWAVVGERVVAADRVTVGARDTAREGSPARLGEALRHLFRKIGDRCRDQGQPPPALGVAAGMITSAEGLVDVPHVEAPADAGHLARSAELHRLPQVAPLPFVFVPGIRSGPPQVDAEAIGASDVMRGEEVLSLGLAARGHLPDGGLVFSLGSHWKAIHVDATGRVVSSVSTVGGEMLFAVRSHTILASSVPRGWPPSLPAGWVAAGRQRGHDDGLPRALYCVRLLDQRTPSSLEERLAFLVGATIAAHEKTLLPRTALDSRRVVLVGAPALVEAWTSVLRDRALDPVGVEQKEREAAFRAGCRAVLEAGDVGRPRETAGLEWRPPR